VGATPCSGTENDLDLLTTGKTPHGIVGDELRLETEVSKVFLDFATNEGSKKTETLSFTSVDLEDFLLSGVVDSLAKSNGKVRQDKPSRNHA